jgi:8-oxo-dGTP pyrophosphatase MutT (NUDIX family)
MDDDDDDGGVKSVHSTAQLQKQAQPQEQAQPPQQQRRRRRLRSGATVFCRHRGEVYVLLGAEYYGGRWTDFGGSVHANETVWQGAAREFHEETMGLVATRGVHSMHDEARRAETEADMADHAYTRRIDVSMNGRRHVCLLFEVPWFNVERRFDFVRAQLRRINKVARQYCRHQNTVRAKRSVLSDGRHLLAVGDRAQWINGDALVYTVRRVVDVSYGNGGRDGGRDGGRELSVLYDTDRGRRRLTFGAHEVHEACGTTAPLVMVQALYGISHTWSMLRRELLRMDPDVRSSGAVDTDAGPGGWFTRARVHIEFLEKSSVRWWSIDELRAALGGSGAREGDDAPVQRRWTTARDGGGPRRQPSRSRGGAHGARGKVANAPERIGVLHRAFEPFACVLIGMFEDGALLK